MKFARRAFLVAGIYGLIVLVPLYFLEVKTGVDYPPAITHPEYYYGFIGVGVAWQLVFLMIAGDPIRYRPIMLAAIVEKASFGLPAIWLFLTGRLHLQMLLAGLIDMSLGALFIMAYTRTAVAKPQ
jgi:hypothetical protein